MNDELWVMGLCPHGRRYDQCESYLPPHDTPCPGGSEERLDPERALFADDPELPGDTITVQDILDALGDP